MLLATPSWQILKPIKDLLMGINCGNIFINENCAPSIEITKNTPNASIHLSLDFESIAHYKAFIKELEDKIPVLEAEFNNRLEEHYQLNPELRKKK